MINLKGNPFFLSDEDVKWVEEIKGKMTTEDKILQLFFPIGYSPNEMYLKHEILARKPGGLMFRTIEKENLFNINTYLQENSEIPMFLSGNLEAGGDGLILEGTAFGNQLQVAATGDVEQAYRLGLVSCSEASAVGSNYTFAPVADIDINYHNPITNVRTYGSDKEVVKNFGLAYMKGANESGMAVSVKHFPGDGVDEVDQHILTSVNTLSTEDWDNTFGDVYSAFIESGAKTIMVGHIALPSYEKYFNADAPNKLIPATLSKAILQDLLRKKMGFNGMIITDASPMVGFLCAMDREQSVPYCIEVGCDMILFNKNYDEDIEFMKKGYENGTLSEKRLDEAVTRILATKASIKLHSKKANGTLAPNKDDLSFVGNETHKAWAKECAEKAVTLVKDTQNLLPINPKKHKRVLLEILGECKSDQRVVTRFKENLLKEGFEVTIYEKEVFDFTKPFKSETVNEFKNKYDLVIYLGNVENASNKTTSRLNWHAPYGAGNNIPWFVEVVPTLFISLQNPYHLLDVPMIKTYINAYSNNNQMLDTVVEKIMGKTDFVGVNPVDPFCGKKYLAY